MTRRLHIRRDDGFTLVEVMVAAMILVVGLLGTLAAMDSGKRSTTASQRAQQAFAYAQGYVEQMAATKWSELALSATPATGAAPPRSYVTCGGGACSLAIHTDFVDSASPAPTGVTSPEQVLTGGTVPPTISLPGGAGTAYQYVTKASDQCVMLAGAQRCPAKRLTVAVVLTGDATHSVTQPVWISTVVTDPGVTPL